MKERFTPPPIGLICELLRYHDGVAINNPKPKLGWMIDDPSPNTFQIASRIMVATSAELLLSDQPDMLDTKEKNVDDEWTSDSRSLHVEYNGHPLAPNSTYYWKVRIWNNRGERSYWSTIAVFHTGDFDPRGGQIVENVISEPVSPLKMIHKSKERLFVDFGSVGFGTLVLKLDLDEDKTIEVLLGEISDGVASVCENPGGARRFKKLTFTLKSGERSHRLVIPSDETNTKTIARNGNQSAILMPEHIGEVTPFRYCELIGDLGNIGKHQISRLTAHYPFDDSAAAFHCSSRVLNDIWELCKYSIKATSFLGIYVDGDRERIPYEADAYINQLCHYYCDREFAMARKSHEYLLTHPNYPTEWIMFSIMMAWKDYEYTGDLTFLLKHFDDLKAKALIPLERDDGLISTSSECQSPEILQSIHLNCHHKIDDIIDWPECERDSYDIRSVNTVTNAFHAHVLELLAKIADAIGERADAEELYEKFKKTKRAMNKLLMDSSRGVFVDGEGSTHISLHANMFPLAFGLVDDDKIPIVADFVESKGMACSVYGAQFLLEALYNTGNSKAALALMTSTGERGWARWIYDLDSTISLEAWDNSVKPNQDWNHAWGASPGNIIPRFLMGIRPLSAGFEKILIKPQPGSLEYAGITVPTIRGDISAVFRNSPGVNFYLEFALPANTSARIALPCAVRDSTKISLDGNAVTGLFENDCVIIDNIGPGRHRVNCAI